ncbi:LxmA leader domain family RiPP [Streptomyces sp. NPDC008313]|uniref:LxmA leader domain family RiPP n=1 Tax=Streptomyces sp. NPDC008313 TaxID=3364826 RepID=UPI0036ECA83E
MSTQDLMNGFTAYTDVEELAAESVADAAEQQSPLTISLISISVVTATYEAGC